MTVEQAAQAMGQTLQKHGHRCQVVSISAARQDQLLRADLICIGSWVKGWFILRQHPTAGIMNFLQRLDTLAGKDAIVFCTYKIAVGSTLRQMAHGLEAQGARVIAMFKFRGPEPDEKFNEFAATL